MSGLGIGCGGGMFGGESIPVLEAMLSFASQRQLVLLDNVANWNTPNFKARDLPVSEFQKLLSKAIEQRETGAQPLELVPGRYLRREAGGGFTVRAGEVDTGSMRHDGNTVVIDQEQTKLLENAMSAQIFSRLLARKFRMLHTAISGRLT